MSLSTQTNTESAFPLQLSMFPQHSLGGAGEQGAEADLFDLEQIRKLTGNIYIKKTIKCFSFPKLEILDRSVSILVT